MNERVIYCNFNIKRRINVEIYNLVSVPTSLLRLPHPIRTLYYIFYINSTIW